MNSTIITAANERGMQPASSNVRLPKIDGFVHTCEIRILPRPGIDLQHDLTSRKAPRRITGWRSGSDRRQATCRFNPNNETVKSPVTGDLLRRGNCTSLADFEQILSTWAEQHGFVRDDIRIKRLDYALDCHRDDDAALFKKLCDLLIGCFSVHREVDDYGSYFGETFLTMRPKNNKAIAKKRDFVFERYSKYIESPDHGAIWRTELRYTYPRKTTGDPLTALNKIVDELKVLPAYIEAAEAELNANLYRDFQEKQARSGEALSVAQYILENDGRFFSHRQVRRFYALVHGINEDAAESRACGYIRGHKHLFVSKGQFRNFIKTIITSIQNYVGSDMFLKGNLEHDGLCSTSQSGCSDTGCGASYTNTNGGAVHV